MKKIIVIPNVTKDAGLSLTSKVVSKLASLGVTAYLDEKYEILGGSVRYSIPPDDAEAIIVIGGDGSVIDASVLAIEMDIPLLGINLGKVGYLAMLDADELERLSDLVEGRYAVDERMLLAIEKCSADGTVTVGARLAVNEVIVCHDSYLGLTDIKIENSYGDQVLYRADGVIFATPQGTTAYSLSAGGPIISHQLDSITLTPVCPHTFFNRSIVYGPDDRVSVTNMGYGGLNISIDGRLSDHLDKGDRCSIYRSDKRVKMIAFGHSNLFSTLSKKIKLLHDLV